MISRQSFKTMQQAYAGDTTTLALRMGRNRAGTAWCHSVPVEMN
jgi:hypothetical protein